MAFTNHTITTLPSSAVVHIWSPTPGTRHAILILQHGFGEYAERYVTCFNELIPTLTKRGFEVRALDIIGHGNSPGARGVCDVRKAVQDHIQVRSGAAEGNENVPIFLLGHSMGALVTAGSVAADGRNINGVILTGMAFPAKIPIVARYLLNTLACFAPSKSIFLKPSSLSGLSRIPEIVQLAEEDPRLLKGQISYLVATSALDTADSIRNAYSEWRSPTLVFHGTSDSYADVNGSIEFVKGINSEDKKLSLYDEGMHELLNDLPRDEVLKEILDWLQCHIDQDL